MENCLFTKFKSSFNNNSLRHFEKLYFKVRNDNAESGYAATKLSFAATDSSHKYSNKTVLLKIANGDAVIYNYNNSSALPVDANGVCSTDGAVTIRVNTGEATIIVENFDSTCDRIVQDTFISNSLSIGISTIEVGRLSMQNLKASYYYNTNNIVDILAAKNIERFDVEAPITGSLSYISSLTNLTDLVCGRGSAEGMCTKDFQYSLDDIAALNKDVKINIQGGNITGGDLYTLFNSKDTVNITLQRANFTVTDNHYTVLTCNYTSGTDTPPSCTLVKAMISVGEMALDNIKNALKMIKDGIDGHTITLSGTPMIRLKKSASQDLDTEASNLITYLNNNGCNVSVTNSNVL